MCCWGRVVNISVMTESFNSLLTFCSSSHVRPRQNLKIIPLQTLRTWFLLTQKPAPISKFPYTCRPLRMRQHTPPVVIIALWCRKRSVMCDVNLGQTGRSQVRLARRKSWQYISEVVAVIGLTQGSDRDSDKRLARKPFFVIYLFCSLGWTDVDLALSAILIQTTGLNKQKKNLAFTKSAKPLIMKSNLKHRLSYIFYSNRRFYTLLYSLQKIVADFTSDMLKIANPPKPHAYKHLTPV